MKKNRNDFSLSNTTVSKILDAYSVTEQDGLSILQCQMFT